MNTQNTEQEPKDRLLNAMLHKPKDSRGVETVGVIIHAFGGDLYLVRIMEFAPIELAHHRVMSPKDLMEFSVYPSDYSSGREWPLTVLQRLRKGYRDFLKADPLARELMMPKDPDLADRCRAALEERRIREEELKSRHESPEAQKQRAEHNKKCEQVAAEAKDLAGRFRRLRESCKELAEG